MLQSPWTPEPATAASVLAAPGVEPGREPPRMLGGEPPGRLAGEDVVERTTPEQRQRDFIALIGHELRNPLTAIIGYAQLMQRAGSYDEKALTAILAQAAQINRLVGDLLDGAQLEAGQLHLRLSRMDLVAVARASTQQAQLTSPIHTVRLESPNGLLDGWWDRDRLAQVFANLLGNAIKYSRAGSEILVQVEDLGSAARVSIEDHGAGIAPAALPRLFERFYRAPATAARVPGLGLGLYVTRALVEAHGGRLEVESLFGQGSVFSFTLPRLRNAPPAEDEMGGSTLLVGSEIASRSLSWRSWRP